MIVFKKKIQPLNLVINIIKDIIWSALNCSVFTNVVGDKKNKHELQYFWVFLSVRV